MGKRARRYAKVAFGLLAIAAVGVALSVPPRLAGKTEPAPNAMTAASAPVDEDGRRHRLVDIEPEAQREGHTCGLHAVRMVYSSYGIDPDGFELRKRLGVDTPAIRWLAATTGMLPQDLLRVLDQDGFTWELLGPDDVDAVEQLKEHIENDVALCVVPFGGSDFHWVTLRSDAEGEPLLLDPAGGSARAVNVQEFLTNRALSVLTVRIKRDSDPPNQVLSDGLRQVAEVMEQVNAHR